MLSEAQNPILTRTGPGTAMGALFRRFCDLPFDRVMTRRFGHPVGRFDLAPGHAAAAE